MNPSKCRDLRHAWDFVTDEITEKKRRQVISFRRNLICIRCGTVRQDSFKIVHEAIVRSRTTYVYPEGYRMPKGMRIEDIRYQLFRAGDM